MSNDKGASVRARLPDIAKAENSQFEGVLDRFALERLLYRLSISPHADRFVLKGALLFNLWYDMPHRTTRDALIAATALVHGMTLVTRNDADFKPAGVTLINPWEGSQ